MRSLVSVICAIILVLCWSSGVVASQSPVAKDKAYIPIPAKNQTRTYHLKLQSKDPQGRPLGGYSGRVSIVDGDRVQFITLPNKDVKLDSGGTARIPFQVKQPTEGDWEFLEDIPMEVTFAVDIFKKNSFQPLKTIKRTYPLGMFLIHGRTVGPTKTDIFAFEPRYIDSPPILNTPKLRRIYEIGSQVRVGQDSKTNRDGEFYVLARIPDKSELNFQVAKDTLYLHWKKSAITKRELSHRIRVRPDLNDVSKDIIHDHESVREQVGKTIEIGDVDILSIEEHLKRIRGYVKGFIEKMPLTRDARASLLGDLAAMTFVDDGTSGNSGVPLYVGPSLTAPLSTGHIVIPGDPGKYFAKNPFQIYEKGASDDPVYMIMFHELGHFVHGRLIETWLPSGYYKIMKNLGSDHSTWTVPKTSVRWSQKVVAFNESNADFFALLMFEYLKKKHPEFSRSIYYNPGYTKEFFNSRKARAVQNKGGCVIEGVQTTFLRKIYGDQVKVSPSSVYGDYLKTMVEAEDEAWIEKWAPARTAEEWVATRKKNPGLPLSTDLLEAASQYNIVPCQNEPVITATNVGKSEALIEVNGKACSMGKPQDFCNLLVLDKVKLVKGDVNISFHDPGQAINANLFPEKGAMFSLYPGPEVKIHEGLVGVSGKFKIQTPTTYSVPKGTSSRVEVLPDGTTNITVVSGSISVETEKESGQLVLGESALVGRDGKIVKSVSTVVQVDSKLSEIFAEPVEDAEVSSKPGPSPDLTAGLLLSYDFTSIPLEDKVEDLSGNGHNGILHNTVFTGGSGLYFNGENAYVEVESGEAIHSDRAVTVVGEFLTTSYAQKHWQSLVWKGNLPDRKGGVSDCTQNCENREFSLWLNNAAYLHSTSTSKDRVGQGQTELNSPGGSIVGKTAFAQVVDSETGKMHLFINGEQVSSRAYSKAGLRRTDGPLVIGGGGPVDKSWNFRGYLRWLKIYNRALTADEVAAVSDYNELGKDKPWRNPYQLDDAVVRGGWATVSPIQDDPFFEKLDLGKLEPGVTIQNGWFTHPTDRRETEVVYRHDGSPLRLSGHATVLDCLDHCAGGAGMIEQVIRGDGQVLWESGKIRQKEPGKDFDVDLTGVKEVRLVTTDGGNGIREDWAAWLNLKLTWPEPGTVVTTKPKPARPQPAEVEIVDSSGRKGHVDAVYTLDRKPDGSQLLSMSNFPGETEEIFVWFQYSDLEPGDVLTGVWTDIGRKRELRVVPVVVAESKGAAGFALRRPLSGWFKGNYLVEIKRGEKVLNSSEFRVSD